MNTTQTAQNSMSAVLGGERTQHPNLRRDGALLLLRCAAALPLGFHGSQKLLGWFGGGGLAPFAEYLQGLGVPFPAFSALLAAVSELAGALILVTGRGYRALPPVVFTMVVAAATSFRNGFDVQRGGAEFPLTLAMMLVALALLTPGSFVVRSPQKQGGAR